MQQKVGAGANAHCHSKMTPKRPRLEATIWRRFPSLLLADRAVSLGDGEPCLCASTVVGHRAQRGRPIGARLRHAALLGVRPRGAELGWPARAA
mmetsp:Transcript_153326/g.489909  ORF Transcript_153326/g.489909 Transcript_153326/m.489909 type:complete len:94 (+) Transcript_153326:346-627(+)